MDRISRFLDRIYLAGAWMSGALLILLCGLVLYSILARLIGTFAGGATDMAGYVMATSTFMALAYTFRTHGHIRIVLLIQRTRGAARLWIERWALAMSSAIACFLAFYMVRLVVDSYEFEERSEGADAILLWIPQTPVAVGSVLLALAVVHTFVESLVDPAKFDPDHLNEEARSEV